VFSFDLLAAAVKGSFRATPRTLGAGEEALVGLSSSFGGGTAVGSLFAGRKKGESGSSVTVATWKAP